MLTKVIFLLLKIPRGIDKIKMGKIETYFLIEQTVPFQTVLSVRQKPLNDIQNKMFKETAGS